MGRVTKGGAGEEERAGEGVDVAKVFNVRNAVASDSRVTTRYA